MEKAYKALISSDWNQCLAPCSPFDAISDDYPDLHPIIDSLFKAYTTNTIPLDTVVRKIRRLVPEPITRDEMDAYPDRHFQTYQGVGDLIRNCLDNGILFMINTTGMLGYFQRAMAKELLPRLPVLSAHTMIQFEKEAIKADCVMPLREIEDKAVHKAEIAARYQIPTRRIVLLGDSGGDGPHFLWGARNGARRLAIMCKPSLTEYCRRQNITIDNYFGLNYSQGRNRDIESEMIVDFTDLFETIQQYF